MKIDGAPAMPRNFLLLSQIRTLPYILYRSGIRIESLAMRREELLMPDIPKETALALYALFDEIHARLIRARGITLGPVEELITAINEANEYASAMEDLWSTGLTLEERATLVE
jgi:hypothetical protein